MKIKRLAITLALSCVLPFPAPANAATRKKPKAAAPEKVTVHEKAVSTGITTSSESLSTGPVNASDSPLVRAAKSAKAVRTQNAAEGRATTPLNDWKAKSLGSLGPSVSPVSGSLATAGIYDKRASGSSGPSAAPAQRSAATVQKDLARTAEQMLEYTPNEEEDEGAVERQMEQLSKELQKAPASPKAEPRSSNP